MAGWLPNPDPIQKATGKDISTYRDMRADAHVGGGAEARAASGARACVGAGASGDRGVLADLWATPDADEPGARPGVPALIGEALDGALYGYQPLEITWGRMGGLLVPTVVRGKPSEWFHFDADNHLRFKSREAEFRGRAAAGPRQAAHGVRGALCPRLLDADLWLGPDPGCCS